MEEWKKTSCALCSSTCGLEMKVENNRIMAVRGDEDNPRTHGYCCRKARGMQYFQHNPERLLYPLKRVGENKFERISWEQAAREISARIREIAQSHGPKTVACQGLGGFLGQLHTVMAKQFMAAVGTQYHFRALAAELTGFYWSCGVMLGNQTFIMHPDEEESEVFCASGWNPYVTHNMVEGRRIIREFSTNPDKVLIVIDPRRSETACMADIHLAIRPGTDAVLWRAMVALVLKEGWYNKAYIEEHVSDLEKILPWFEGIDIRRYIEFCELDYEEVYKVTHILATRRSSLHSDLGVICGRHTSLVTHIQNIFLAICGNLLVPGGNCFMTAMIPGVNSTDPKLWKLNYTRFPQIFGIYPTAALADEIDNDTPDRIRALICCHSNPLHSNVDTKRHREAFKRLDFLVTIDCVMTETARESDYVLPSATGFEGYEINTMSKSFPGIYHHLRHPIIKPEGEIRDAAWIWVQLVKAYGALPELPETLYEAARKAAQGGREERKAYGVCLGKYLEEHPGLKRFRLAIVGETLGTAMDSVTLAQYWAMLQTVPERFRVQAEAAGFPKGPDQIEEIYETVLAHPEGVCVGKMDVDHMFDYLETEDKKIHLYAEELNEWIYEITPEQEAKELYDPEYPMVLNAGRHFDANINHTMRDPDWVKGKEDIWVLTIHPEDGKRLRIADGQMAKVTTRTGEMELPAKYSMETRKNSVIIPHGFGFMFRGKPGPGVNVNWLTTSKGLDRLAGTPIHRYVPCRVEPAGKRGEEDGK